MKHELKALGLIAVLLVGSLSQVGCGNTQTLDKVGRVAVALAKGFSDEVAALKAAGVTGKRLEAAERAAKQMTAAADNLNAILQNAKNINEKDAAAVVGYAATITATIGGLLQNPDFLGLGESSLLVKVARYSSVALNQLSLTLAIYFPPKPPGASIASDGGKTIAVKKIKIEFPEPPAEVRALMAK